MSWNENLDKKRRGRKRKSDQSSGEDAFPGDLSFIGRRGKRGKRDVTTLEGYTYKETEGCVEIWEKEVKKGIKAKRAKCVGLIRDEKGEERICGKIFGRVPNCKRHVGVHQKSKGRSNIAEKNENDDSFEILDDDEEDNLKGDSSSSEEPTKDPAEPTINIFADSQLRQCETCFKWKGSSEMGADFSGDLCICGEKKQSQTVPMSRLFPASSTPQLPTSNSRNDVSISSSGFCLPLTPPVHEPEIIWASDDDDSKDEFDLSHYLDQKSDDLGGGGSLTDLIKMEWASFNDVLHFYAVANYN